MLNAIMQSLVWLVPVIICIITLNCNVVFPHEGQTIIAPSDRCDLTTSGPADAVTTDTITTGTITTNTISVDTITVATFNIHGGRGRDGVSNLARTAAVVFGADFVGLQEAGRGHLADRGLDHTEILANMLGHQTYGLFVVNHRAIWDGGGLFGNGFSTSLPVLRRGDFILPAVSGKGPRGLGWVEAKVGDRLVEFFIIHATLSADPAPDAVQPQIDAALATIERLCQPASSPCVFMGDFNVLEDGPVITNLRQRFNEVLYESPNATRGPRRDYIFVSKGIEVVTACLVQNDASDHPAIVATLQFHANAEQGPNRD